MRARTLRSDGYIAVSDRGRVRLEHIVIVERAIGRPLRDREEIHHVNGVRADNHPGNLVLCPDHRYHEMLHARQRALDACGNANYLQCKFCGQFADPACLYLIPGRRSGFHRSCRNQYQNARRALCRHRP